MSSHMVSHCLGNPLKLVSHFAFIGCSTIVFLLGTTSSVRKLRSACCDTLKCAPRTACMKKQNLSTNFFFGDPSPRSYNTPHTQGGVKHRADESQHRGLLRFLLFWLVGWLVVIWYYFKGCISNQKNNGTPCKWFAVSMLNVTKFPPPFGCGFMFSYTSQVVTRFIPHFHCARFCLYLLNIYHFTYTFFHAHTEAHTH